MGKVLEDGLAYIREKETQSSYNKLDDKAKEFIKDTENKSDIQKLYNGEFKKSAKRIQNFLRDTYGIKLPLDVIYVYLLDTEPVKTPRKKKAI